MVRTTRRSPSQSPETASQRWTFLSNHAHVLICLAQEDSPRLRDIAGRIGITERAVGAIVHDLEEGGFLERGREGRRNTYRLLLDRPLRHEVERHCDVRELVALFVARRRA